MIVKSTHTLNIFIAYHPHDQALFEEVLDHLREINSKRQGCRVNKVWYDGQDLSMESRQMLSQIIQGADMVLLLMTEDAILSPFFAIRELRQTVQKHLNNELVVIPLILKTCWWEDTVYKQLDILPRAGLPIFDSSNARGALFDQVIHEIDHQLERIRTRKLELETSFHALLQTANAFFDGWEQNPDLLRKAMPLYEEASEHWREGFVPNKEWLENRIDICYREIDFRHYARAAREAFQHGDYETAFFNCKDALELRNDAEMAKLYALCQKRIQEDKRRTKYEPFEKHLKQGHEFFLSLQWEKAREAFTHALEFYEEGFEPTQTVVRHKIDICRREYLLETSLEQALDDKRNQRYAQAAHTLMEGIQAINQEAFAEVEHLLKLMQYLEHVEAFRDIHSGKWGFYDSRTKDVIIAPKYNAAYNFKENLAGVKKWDKWGFIDIEGNEIIPFVYNFVGHFENGKTEVIQGNETFYINHRGERLPDSSTHDEH